MFNCRWLPALWRTRMRRTLTDSLGALKAKTLEAIDGLGWKKFSSSPSVESGLYPSTLWTKDARQRDQKR